MKATNSNYMNIMVKINFIFCCCPSSWEHFQMLSLMLGVHWFLKSSKICQVQVWETFTSYVITLPFFKEECGTWTVAAYLGWKEPKYLIETNFCCACFLCLSDKWNHLQIVGDSQNLKHLYLYLISPQQCNHHVLI